MQETSAVDGFTVNLRIGAYECRNSGVFYKNSIKGKKQNEGLSAGNDLQPDQPYRALRVSPLAPLVPRRLKNVT